MLLFGVVVVVVVVVVSRVMRTLLSAGGPSFGRCVGVSVATPWKPNVYSVSSVSSCLERFYLIFCAYKLSICI
jgi:hypothetical protein